MQLRGLLLTYRLWKAQLAWLVHHRGRLTHEMVRWIFYYYHSYFVSSTKPQKKRTKEGMTATSFSWSQKSRVPHFPFMGLLATDEIERWILWVRQWWRLLL